MWSCEIMTKANVFKMDIDYDYQNDSLFMYILDDYKYKESIELEKNIILDFDENDVPVALEILNASEKLRTEKVSLVQPFEFEMEIDITAESIILNASFKVSFHQKKIDAPVNFEIPNDMNIPDNQTHFEVAIA